jgi:hypothetical protein
MRSVTAPDQIRLRLIGVAVLTATLVCCEASPPTSGAPGSSGVAIRSVQLALHGQPPIATSAIETGGRVRFDGTCVSLDFGDGHAANLIWPTGFRAFAPPLTIIGLSGQPIVREGDEVALGAAEANVPVKGCPTRPSFLVGEISSVNGIAWPDGTPAPPPVSKPGSK